MKMIKRIGILTAGGDCPGLNAAIRAVGKAALGCRGLEVVGIRDGFLGLIEERFLPLDGSTLANILTVGGTILGTSRVKPHRMEIRGKTLDLRDVIVRNCKKHRLEALVCIGREDDCAGHPAAEPARDQLQHRGGGRRRDGAR